MTVIDTPSSRSQDPLGLDDEKPLALRPVEINFSPGPEYAEAARKWQGVPGIERAANGRLWATWYTGGRTEDEENHVVLVTSADDGITWSQPVLVIDPPGEVRASDPVLWHDPLGRLWLFWMQTAHCGITFDGRGGVWGIRCDDSGCGEPTWSRPHRVANGIMMNKPTVLSSGEWLLPCAIWSHKGPYRHQHPEEQYSNVVCSRDQGETFQLLGSADVSDRHCDEHMIIERRDGSLWMLVRRKDGIGEAISLDRGRTWQASPGVALAGPCSRFHIRRLQSGRLLLINHFGFTGRSHLTALLSDDDGLTWPHRLLLDERELVTYPDAVEAPDGTIYVVYDRKRVGEGEILLQSFSEADILRGEPSGYLKRQPVIISQVARLDLGSSKATFENSALIDKMLGVVSRMHPDAKGDSKRSIYGPPAGGELSVPPVRFDGNALRLDCAIGDGGFIRVELEDSSGFALPGYRRKDCLEISGSEGHPVVRWSHGFEVDSLVGKLIRLRFILRDADLYGFQFYHLAAGNLSEG